MRRTRVCAFLFSIVTASLIISNCTQVHAQAKGEVGINFQLGFPQGEFNDNIDNVGFGFGVDGLWMPMEFGVGVSVNYLIYGTDSRREPFSTTIPDVEVEVTTTNSILLGHLLLRLQYPTGVIRPYADGLVGLNYLNTSTEIENLGSISDGGEIASSTNQDDFTFSYGFGGGILIKVFDGKDDVEVESVFIDIGARYIYGGKAEYLKEGSIRRENGKVSFDVIQSRTDIITAHIGAVILF